MLHFVVSLQRRSPVRLLSRRTGGKTGPNLLLFCPEGGGQSGYDLKQIAHNAVVRHGEDGRVGILVDSDDGVRPGHARQMLNGPGNAHGDVHLGGDGLARLAHLMGMGDPACVHSGTACAHSSAHGLRRR